MTAPPGPGSSPPPLIHVGRNRSASSTADDAALAHPHAGRPGIGRQPVDVVERQTGVGDRGQAGVDGQARAGPASGAGRSPSGRRRSAPPGARSGRSRPAAGAPVDSVRPPGRRDRSRPVGSNSGSQTSSCCSKRTTTSWPMRTSSGSQPTMFVVRWTVGSSASATLAMTYGGSNPGSHWCMVDREGDDRSPARHLGRLP